MSVSPTKGAFPCTNAVKYRRNTAVTFVCFRAAATRGGSTTNSTAQLAAEEVRALRFGGDASTGRGYDAVRLDQSPNPSSPTAPHRLEYWREIIPDAHALPVGFRRPLELLRDHSEATERDREFAPFAGVLTLKERHQALSECVYHF